MTYLEAVEHQHANAYKENDQVEAPELSHFVIHWSESAHIHGEEIEIKTVNSFNNVIRQAAAFAPNDGTYDKTKFSVIFTNGQFNYTGRIDITNDDHHYDVRKQMVGYMDYLLNEWELTKDEDKPEIEAAKAIYQTL